MENFKNVISCSVSYRRNIKDMPFVKLLTDPEQAIGVTRSLSEILGEDFEFKSLKNLSLYDCKVLEEEEKISSLLIDNKDISAYGINYCKDVLLLINEQEHIRIKARSKGYNLEKCYKIANDIDDKILEKLEMAFSTQYGFLTSNPKLCGTGMEIEVLLFLPALSMNERIAKLEKELFKNEYVLFDLDYNTYANNSPFVRIKNKYTFGYKENQFAENMDRLVKKLIQLEELEESKIFDFSASHLVDKIFKSFGIIKNAYRLEYNEAINCLANVLWGINLKVLKNKKNFDILDVLCKIKENHLNNGSLNLKEVEKARAKFLANLIEQTVVKGEVDV